MKYLRSKKIKIKNNDNNSLFQLNFKYTKRVINYVTNERSFPNPL